MKQTTLCFLLKENQICLAMKKRGFGAGKWNGYGGKPNPGEDILDAAIRETEEEIGVRTISENLDQVATVKFYFRAKPEWNQEVLIFVSRQWEGDPTETEEMRPQWFDFSEIPFDKMWPDDQHWLPKVLAGKKLVGQFYFDETNEKIDKFDLREI